MSTVFIRKKRKRGREWQFKKTFFKYSHLMPSKVNQLWLYLYTFSPKILQPWSSLAEGDEQPDLPNGQTCM